MQESDNNELVLKLASREKQLTEMAEMLAELNENLNDVQIFSHA